MDLTFSVGGTSLRAFVTCIVIKEKHSLIIFYILNPLSLKVLNYCHHKNVKELCNLCKLKLNTLISSEYFMYELALFSSDPLILFKYVKYVLYMSISCIAVDQ